jgi:hypothetical protein
MRRACVAAAARAARALAPPARSITARALAPLLSPSWDRALHAAACSLSGAAPADTIFALSTSPGRAALAVVRASGPRAREGVLRLLPAGAALPPPRTAALVRLADPEGGGPLDRCLLLFFPAPRSFTGEDVAELHLHGGPAVVAGVLAALARAPVRASAHTHLHCSCRKAPHAHALRHPGLAPRGAGRFCAPRLPRGRAGPLRCGGAGRPAQRGDCGAAAAGAGAGGRRAAAPLRRVAPGGTALRGARGGGD